MTSHVATSLPLLTPGGPGLAVVAVVCAAGAADAWLRSAGCARCSPVGQFPVADMTAVATSVFPIRVNPS